MSVSLIVAMDRNRVIGRAGGLPWHLPADLQRFKRLTMGHPIVMGRKTYESIGRLLPGRTTIIVSRQPEYAVPGAVVCRDLESALTAAAQCPGGEETFLVGGAALYQAALPFVNRLYRTLVETAAEGDTFFPELDDREWRLVCEESHPADERNSFASRFQILERIGR